MAEGQIAAELAKHKLVKRTELPPELENVDIMDLLDQLTPEELEELNNDFDPDNSLLPPSERVKNQTDKVATGKFSRADLIKFLEDKAKKEKDWEQHKPYVKETRGKVWKPKEQPKVDLKEELGIDASEFDDALAKATEEELVDLAAVLGFHGMLNQVQFQASMDNTKVEGGWNSVAQAATFDPVAKLPPNDTDPNKSLDQLKENDPKLKELNLNNIKSMSIPLMCEIAGALKGNTHLEQLHMANTGATDRVCKAISQALEVNKTLKVLNLESNFITGLAVVDLFTAMNKTKTLKEVRLENQRPAVLGVRSEALILKLVEENDTITAVGIKFESLDCRFRIQEKIQKNIDGQTRKERISVDSCRATMKVETD